ncbi:MAG: ATP-binding protein [Candidatus Sulfotelmatobacter sp.]
MKEKALQILLVEDNAGDARLLREMFSKEKPGSFELTHLLRMSEAEIRLAKGGVDIVLLDMGLPDGHGLDTVRRAHAVAPGVPMIVLTGLDDEALAAEALKEGAQDYLIKGQIENRALPRALRHAIERHRMQTETELVRVHQMQFKDEFLSHVSHELRSPLTAIRQFVTILLDQLAGELNVEQRQYLEIVLRNVKQLQSMINDLFEVSGVQAGKLRIERESTSISDAIVYALSTLQGAAAAKGITLSSDIESRLPPVCADPTRIRQILIILVDNAIKFTPANGVVQVQVHILEKDPHLLLLEVSDSGCGVSPDKTERIFERLFQASDPALAGRKGLGLGLYICKDLVTRQGGTIWATSALGRGAVFSVTLPIFSLPNLLAPAFTSGSRTQGPISLVVTELGAQTGWLSDEARAEQSAGIRDLLQRCLHSDRDILLPKMGSAGAVELFFIVAITDAIGGEAIRKRIQERLTGSEHIERAGLTLSTSYRPLAAIERNTSESMEGFLGRLAAKIQDLMNEEITSRMVENG